MSDVISKETGLAIDSFEKVALQYVNLMADCHYKEEQLEYIAKEILGMDGNDESIHLVNYKDDGLVVMFSSEKSNVATGIRVSDFIEKVRNGADKSMLMKGAYL